MSAGRRATIALCAGLALLVLPDGAEAKRGFEVVDRSLRLRLVAPASNGFEMEVETLGHHRIALTINREFERTVTYTTRGRVSRRGIEADFGRLGRIDVRFQRQQRFSSPRGRRCHGRRPVVEFGRFLGTIRFRGEQGFARVNTNSARGAVQRQYRQVCKRHASEGGGFFEDLFRGIRVNYLTAVDRSPNRIVVFETLSYDIEELNELFGVFAIASAFEKREGMRIERSTVVETSPGDVLLSPRGKEPATGTITPSRPFQGTAEFEKAKGKPSSWIGSLRASLPGVGIVPLTGDRFTATVCRFAFLDLLEPRSNRCLRRSGVPLPGPFVVGPAIGAQINGSQSQAFGDAKLSWSR